MLSGLSIEFDVQNPLFILSNIPKLYYFLAYTNPSTLLKDQFNPNPEAQLPTKNQLRLNSWLGQHKKAKLKIKYKQILTKIKKYFEQMRAIYSIEGNIGSGKSTFLNLIKLHIPEIHVIPEPVAEWQKVSNQYNLLDLYYRDPHRWAFTFQINAILSRMKELGRLFQLMDKESCSKKVFFSERSIVADKQIFAKLLHKQGKMSDMEHALYLNMYNSLQNLFKTPRIHRFIYLKSSPQKCMERMAKRARHEQINIELDYLKKIHDFHELWLGQQKNAIIIDGEQEFEKNSQRAKQMVKSVKQFLAL